MPNEDVFVNVTSDTKNDIHSTFAIEGGSQSSQKKNANNACWVTHSCNSWKQISNGESSADEIGFIQTMNINKGLPEIPFWCEVLHPCDGPFFNSVSESNQTQYVLRNAYLQVLSYAPANSFGLLSELEPQNVLALAKR